MPGTELELSVRLLAGGGPSTPDPRVLRAVTTPLIGQFDPDFTTIMDDVVQLARDTLLTRSPHCFAISALASGGMEAVLNSLVESNARVAVSGSAAFTSAITEMLRRYGAQAVALDAPTADLMVVPAIDPFSCERLPLNELAEYAHARGAPLVVDATLAVGACELRVDDWGIDVCVAGADYAIGAPSGMSLVAYSPEMQAHMQARAQPPTTSYLDLLQLQAYWSPERLNHHTAPTSLVYGLREALRLVQLESLSQRWQRHAQVGHTLRERLEGLGLHTGGHGPYALVHLPTSVDEERTWRALLDEFAVYVTRVRPRVWRLGLLGADARPANVHRVLAAFEKVVAA